MRQFLKFTFASCLGVFLAIGALFLFFLFIGLSAAMTTTKPVKGDSVLEIALDYTPPEKTNNVQSVSFANYDRDILGTRDIIRQIARAADDSRIKGIYFDPTFMALSPPSAAEVADALIEFRQSGKFVYTYAPFYGQGSYYLATASDSIMINPIGSVDFRGFASFVPFFKDMLDKVGVKMQIYYAGQFKSATEPFRRTDMSPQNKLQTRAYLNDVYAEFLEDIGRNRNMDPARLREIADELRSTDAESAVALGLVDAVGYKDEAFAWMASRMGLSEGTKPDMISLQDYYKSGKSTGSYSSDRIAVVIAEGSINYGEQEYGMITDGHFTEFLDDIRKSSRIKAVVLRVNSPGGNILAAENILRSIKRIQEAGKPVVVSMGDFAASGGYYISASADSIFAASNTLTGSIGVFTLVPNPVELLNDKLGIQFDTVRTGDYSASFTPFFEWSDEEDAFFQKRVDDFYTLFLEKVAEGRNMTIDEVDEIAQGRVWTGKRAVEIGLVDRIGGLDEAIAAAASLAGLEEYSTTEYPKLQDPLNRMITEFTKQNTQTITDKLIDAKLRRKVPHYDEIRELVTTEGPVARLPFVVQF